jgi:hypothetical protein
VVQFKCGTRILRVIHGRDARATSANCITTGSLGPTLRFSLRAWPLCESRESDFELFETSFNVPGRIKL